MKKKDKKTIEDIKKCLSPIDDQNALPEELSKENIEKILMGEKYRDGRARKNKTSGSKMVRIGTGIAAVLILSLGLSSLSDVISGQIKYNSISGEVKKAEKYDEIENIFIDLKKKQEKKDGSSIFYRMNQKNIDMPESIADNSLDENKSMASAQQDHSQTNTQVSGVDEADIIKNDGRYIYIASQKDNSIIIVDA
ncbi:MAG: beta-propeller domain-containing protein, partial [Oscillospiraceae bacterium]|nr:beta-propeller domain-containing protein [Oscillospiraceae bacterium]